LQLNLVGSKFYGQRVKSVVQELLERIIHKAVALYPIERFKMSRGNQNPVMAVKPQFVGAGMASVLGAFIDYL
jgi:hypothetical protein